MAQTAAQPSGLPTQWRLVPRTYFRGIGQVMFQQSSWTGLLFLIGIFWGSYASGMPLVAWGAVLGTAAATFAGYLLGEPDGDGDAGLWGFNGVLVGCAFPTFLASTWVMWVGLVFFAMLSTWMARAYNNFLGPWKVSSFTFPFVTLTWIMLFASRIFDGLPTFDGGLSTPALPDVTTAAAASGWTLDMGFGNLVVYWLKGISQVFLVNNWVTGICFLVGLWLCSRWAAIWAALGSAIALAVAIAVKANPGDIANGLFGFSPVLTAIALGCTFYKVNWKTALWAVAGIIATVFIQGAMDTIFQPWGLPTLTGPFCVATWMFLLPKYGLLARDVDDNSPWTRRADKVADAIDADLNKVADKL